MAFQSLDDLDFVHLDVLREIGNIGSGNAATSLASMLNTTVDIEVPTISLIHYDNVSQYLGGKDQEVVGLSVGLEGDLTGVMLHVVQCPFVSKIVNTFYPKEINSLSDVTEMELSAVKETSNITTAAYVNSLAQMTNMFINITPPSEHLDTVENILQTVAQKFHSVGSQVIYIDENLIISGSTIKSSMILVLELDSLKKLFEKLFIPF